MLIDVIIWLIIGGAGTARRPTRQGLRFWTLTSSSALSASSWQVGFCHWPALFSSAVSSSAGGRLNRLPTLASELARLWVDIFVVGGEAPIHAAIAAAPQR